MFQTFFKKFQNEDFLMLLGIQFQILAPVNLVDFWVLCCLSKGVCKVFVGGRPSRINIF